MNVCGRKTNGSQIASGIHIVVHGGIIADDHTGLVVGGNFLTIIGASQRVVNDTGFVRISDAEIVQAVIETVTACKDIFINCTSGNFHVGGAVHHLVLPIWVVGIGSRIHPHATHITTDVAAAIHSANMTILHLYPSAVAHVTHLAATIEIVNQHCGAVHHHFSAVIEAVILETSIGESDGTSRGRSHHITCVTATIYGADTAGGQIDSGQAIHLGSVVAAEEGADVINTCAIPRIVAIDFINIVTRPTTDGVCDGIALTYAVHRNIGSIHAGRVATSENGVALAAVNKDFCGGAIYFVTATVEIGYAEVTTNACVCGGVGFGAIHLDVMLAIALATANVVAAEDSVNGAAVDGNGVAVIMPITVSQEGILGTAKQGVNLDGIVGCYHDGGLFNLGEIQGIGRGAFVGPYRIADLAVWGHGVHRAVH